jgi:hypothetical protein
MATVDHQEPEPADPDYVDQRAGDLQVGSYGYVVLYERNRKLPPKHPVGFAPAVKP